MRCAYTVARYSRDHRLLWESDPIASRSFVKAFLQFVYTLTTNLTQSIIDINAASQTVSSAALANCDVCHPGLDSKDDIVFMSNTALESFQILSNEKGIVVGTGSTAVAVADDNLVTPIAHGTSAGQFVHYGCYGLNYSTGASSASFDVEREFRNSSGGSIVVAEIGIYVGTSMNSDTDSNAKSFCIIRDVLGATVTVLNGEYLKVKYTITVSN